MRLRIGTKICPDDPMEDGMPVFIEGKELFQHITLLGKSGAGKTMQLLNWIISFLMARIAVIMVEPSGSLAQAVWSASGRRAIYCSLKHPVPINPMLLPFDPDTISSIVRESMNMVVSITTNQANKDMTVKMAAIADRSIKDCLAAGKTSLEDVMHHIAGLRGDSETRDGIVSRLKFILANPRMRHILCGPGTLDVGKLAAEGRPFIMDCSAMTTEAMIFVGNCISMAVRAHLRFVTDYSKLKPLALVLDESHNFTSPTWSSLLKEGRRISLCCILCSQELIFFSEPMRRVLLNVGSLVSFRLGANEASYVARELHIRPEILQFEEKYCAHYLTPSQRGIVRAPHPPVLRLSPLPTSSIEPITTSPVAPAAPQPMPYIHWFPIQPLPPPVTTTPEAAPVEAH